MRGYGIGYDTGISNLGVSTREAFDPRVVRREMAVIRDDLHCTAVRIVGSDPQRLEIAARLAAEIGLEVWFSPFTIDLTGDELLSVLDDCAERAERLREQGAEVVLVTGAELSLFTSGFLPGAACTDRIDTLMTAPPPRRRELLTAVPGLVNNFLRRAVARVRERFHGKVSYASIPFEGVDWSPFDMVSVDAYRTGEIADGFGDGIRALVASGKPVAITEFGCCAYRGAAERGARGGMIVEWDGATPVRLDGDYLRDEPEQATYLRELLDIFAAEGVDTAFAYTFASYHLPHCGHGADPRDDLDLAGYGVVKVLDGGQGRAYPDLPWEPKAAFAALADRYRR